MQFPDARILIFSRLPRVGRVKTRLIPLLGEQGACDFHRACLARTLAAIGGHLAPVELWLDSAPQDDSEFPSRQGGDFRVRVQAQGDLGQRMAQALAAGPIGDTPAVLIGTDVPLLSAAYVEQALARLAHGDDIVMGPAEDGGYVLLGLRRVHAALFEDIPWGTGRVAALTRKRCQYIGLSLFELPTLWDVDRPEDIRRLCDETAEGLEDLQAGVCQHLPKL